MVRKHAYDVTQVCDFLRSQGIPVAPFIGYLAAQITPEAFEALRLTANEQGVVFSSSCQDGAYRIVIKDRCANSSTLVQLLTPHYSLLTMNQRQLIFTPDLLL